MYSKAHHRWLTTLLVLSVVWAGCGDDEDQDGRPQVMVSGSYSVEVGQSLVLSVSTTGGSDSAYSWSSSDESVATVTSTGEVTGVKAGEAVITATGADTKARGDHPVVVVAGAGGEAVVLVSGEAFVLTGATVKLTAKTVNGTDSGYTWSSADDAVATVGEDGTVTGVAPGQVTITATGDDSAAAGAMALVVAAEVPYSEKWRQSGHADTTAEAFNHWNEDDPAEVPTDCAKCHSTPGFRDFIGDDGSAVGTVDKAAPIGTVVSCTACHNTAAAALSSVTFPSGVAVGNLGPEARCMTCHQGRSSTDDVDKAIADAAATTDDTASDKLDFENIHYYAAGATLLAGRVRGGYQYAGKVYDWRFRHVPGKETCVQCHDPHSLKVRVDTCAGCHAGVTTADDAKKIRMISSAGVDYDGDGNLTEGIYDELVGVRDVLLQAITAYGSEMSAPICYSAANYPYWFKDTDGDGSCSATEAVYANGYDKWTPRLLRAAYNYQVALKDPGAFAHNAKYIIQLLYDSIEDLNVALTSKIDMSQMHRNDPGHFNGAGEAARHWDEDESVSADCSKCHGGAEGFRFFAKYGVGKEVLEQDNGLDCATCHEALSGTFDLLALDKVTYPSKITLESKGDRSNLCRTCHSGRESKATVDAAIAAGELEFKNVHYLPAAATKAGTTAKVGYEYSGKTYAGPWTGHPAGDGCIDCHRPKQTNHSFAIKDIYTSDCTGCHSGTTLPEEIRGSGHGADYDGDGSSSETLQAELAGLASALLSQIQTAAGSDKLCYNAGSYPYWFKDTDGDGSCSASEASYSNAYASWSAPLMKAAFNYQFYNKEPGAWAHNFDYMAQLLIDSIADLGGSVTSYVRP